jgi:hypothetical protein
LSFVNPLYLEIGDTQEQLIKTLGAHTAAATTPHAITLVYRTNGSCANLTDVFTVPPKPIVSGTTMSYVLAGQNPALASPTCTLDAATPIDVGNAALFISSCAGQAPAQPAGVSAQQGPIQAYTLVVPNASSQTAITAEEAYFVFGFGNNDGFNSATNSTPLSPWNDTAFIFTRLSTKSTLLTWVHTLSQRGGDVAGDPRTFTPAKFLGTALNASSDVVGHVTGVTGSDRERTIGLLGAEVYDSNPTVLRELAFQWFDQKHAYFPDSALGAKDKRNLRDGHYAVWSPTFWIENVNTDGSPTKTDADYVINLILGKQQQLQVNPVDDIISVGLVPSCAMQVNRSVEGGPLSLFDPTSQCRCYYDSKVGTSSCATCNASTPCATGVCSPDGFCEAK